LDYGLILGEAKLFSRRLADQRKPIDRYVSQQRPEKFHHGTCLHSHPQRDRLSFFRKTDESDVPGPFDRSRQLALVPHAIAGDTPRDDPTPLSEEISQQPDIFEIDRPTVDAKPARPSPLKKSSATLSISTLLFTLHKPSP
jgi:hypothetical protein